MKRFRDQALLLCNGDPPPRTFLRKLIAESGYVVAADGGANIARRIGIRPRVIIGDLDSISAGTKRYFASTLLLRVRRQDNTDLEKGLDFILAQGYRKVVIAGATGKRIDFTLANLSLLWRYTDRLDVEAVGDGWRALPVRGKLALHARRGTTVSIIPFGRCRGVTLRGLKYPLRNASLHVGQVGVSNVVATSPFTVEVREGKLLVLILDQKSRIGS
jgi:thiamine pyrophosphokinase